MDECRNVGPLLGDGGLGNEAHKVAVARPRFVYLICQKLCEFSQQIGVNSLQSLPARNQPASGRYSTSCMLRRWPLTSRDRRAMRSVFGDRGRSESAVRECPPTTVAARRCFETAFDGRSSISSPFGPSAVSRSALPQNSWR